ncbi:MAG: hypothetical protein R2873_03865 [Caldilineaceae bacterium]
MTAPVVESPILAHLPLEGTTEAQLLEQLLRSPRLPVVAEALGAKVAEEAARRQQFIDTVLESEKPDSVPTEKKSCIHQSNSATMPLRRAFVVPPGNRRACISSCVGYEKAVGLLSATTTGQTSAPCLAAVFEPDQMRFPAPDFVVKSIRVHRGQ